MIVATDSRDAIKSIHNLLFTWQQFLRKHSTDGLSEQARVGLFGELEILYSLFLKQLNKTVALEGWRGCKKAHQDFQYHDFALEVKTTRAVTPELINISNARQLDNENISSLFLTVVNVDQNPSSGISLQDQVERIRDCLSGASIDLFEEGLLKVGFLDKHKKSYEKELYSVKSISHFKISDGFPHILHSHIPEGVKQVKYKISISSCYSYKVENSFVAKSVKQLAQTLEDE